MPQRSPFSPRWLATSPGVSIDYLDEGVTEIDPTPKGLSPVIERVVATWDSFRAAPAPAVTKLSPVPMLLVAIAAVIGVSIGFVLVRSSPTPEAFAASPPRMVTLTEPSAGVTLLDDVRPIQKPRVTVSMKLAPEPVAKRVAKPAKRVAKVTTSRQRRPIRVDASTALGTLRVK